MEEEELVNNKKDEINVIIPEIKRKDIDSYNI